MKRRLLFVLGIFFLIPVFTLSAQDKKAEEQKRQELENFRAKRVDYFTKEIGLTEKEAREFWPICNELDEKKFELNRNMRLEIKKVRDAQKAGKNVSDAEYDNLINIVISTKEKEVELDKEYIKKMRKILSAEKVSKYQRAEYKFARETFSTPNR